jgi:hypothetical protein
MRITQSIPYTLISLLCLFQLVLPIAQAQQSTVPEKRQHIRQLIVLLGGADGLKRSMQDEIATLSEKYPSLKKEYWESLTQKIDEKELPALIDRLIRNVLTEG